MIEWRKTAGGVEIAEHEDMTCVVCSKGYAEVFKNGVVETYRDYLTSSGSKQWFEREYCQPKYTIEKFEDGGEVYKSLDGKRVVMVSRRHDGYMSWRCCAGKGKRDYVNLTESQCRDAAIAYVTGKDS